MKRVPTPVGFHGISIRSEDPEALVRRLRNVLGWPVLERGRRATVLGWGPELFVEIRRAGPGQPEGVAEIHLAVEELSRARRKAAADPLGGDSWSRAVSDRLSITLREFQRAPAARWRKKRPPA